MAVGVSYPLVVRAQGWGLIAHIIGSVLLTAVMMAGIAAMLPGVAQVWYTAVFIAGGVLLALFFAWDGVRIATHRTIFEANRVTVGDLFGEREMGRSEMAGWRWSQSCAGLGRVELYRRGAENGRPLIVSIPKQPNATVAAWFEEAPDLTLKAKIENLQEIEADQDYGHTPPERLRNAVAEERFAGVVHWLAIGVALWIMTFPTPYWTAIWTGILLPCAVVALTVMRRDRWRIDRGKADWRPQTGVAIFVVALGLCLRAFFDWNVVDGWRLVGIVAGFALVSTVVVAVLAREELDPTKACTWAVVAAIYAYGAFMPANEWFDQSDPTPYRAVVDAKDSDGVLLRPWGPITAAHEVRASERMLTNLEEGGEACMLLFRGALGVRTYDMVSCENGPYHRRR